MNVVRPFNRVPPSGVMSLFMALWLISCVAPDELTPTGTATPAVPASPVINLTEMSTLTPAVPTATPKPMIHVVQPGESLISIATDNGITLDVLLEINNIKDPNMIFIGQQLLVPVTIKQNTGVVATGQSPQFFQTPLADCVLDSEFVADVTIPDNTAIQPGAEFSKIWRLRNTGNCNWPDGIISLEFVAGNKMDAPERVRVSATVSGETVDIVLPMKAPTSPGTHTSLWQLKTDTGTPFGIKPYVRIVVPGSSVGPPIPSAGGASTPPIISGVTSTSRNIYLAGKAMGNRPDVFAKIGDSITFSGAFLTDIGNGRTVWGSYGDLRPVASYFSGTAVRFGNSFNNPSLAALPGWETGDPLDPVKADPSCGGASPLVCEYAAIKPSVAIIMLGTNDSTGNETPEFVQANLEELVNKSIEMGVIPVLTTVPWNSYHDPQEYNAIIIQTARAHDIPLINYWAAMEQLSNHGVGDDGVHPTISADGNGANFSASGLQHGYNLRNLITLQMLDALWRQVLSY